MIHCSSLTFLARCVCGAVSMCLPVRSFIGSYSSYWYFASTATDLKKSLIIPLAGNTKRKVALLHSHSHSHGMEEYTQYSRIQAHISALHTYNRTDRRTNQTTPLPFEYRFLHLSIQWCSRNRPVNTYIGLRLLRLVICALRPFQTHLVGPISLVFVLYGVSR